MLDRSELPRDQAHLDSENDKWNRGLDLFIESLHEPDPKLRGCAHNQKCFNELMWIREYMITHANTLRR